jgi:hypothetical protein
LAGRCRFALGREEYQHPSNHFASTGKPNIVATPHVGEADIALAVPMIPLARLYGYEVLH